MDLPPMDVGLELEYLTRSTAACPAPEREPSSKPLLTTTDTLASDSAEDEARGTTSSSTMAEVATPPLECHVVDRTASLWAADATAREQLSTKSLTHLACSTNNPAQIGTDTSESIWVICRTAEWPSTSTNRTASTPSEPPTILPP